MVQLASLIVLVATLFTNTFSCCSADNVYCVTPTVTSCSSCPHNNHCATLSEFAQEAELYFTSNTTMVFLPGDLASFPGPKRGRRRAWFQPFVHALSRGGIPLHTIDILPCARDARIDTKRNTVRRFIIAKYGMRESHSIVLIQQPIWSYKQTVWAPAESADEKKRLPTGKTIARGNLGFHCASICSFR